MLNLAYTATIGVLILAKKHGVIPSLKVLFAKIESTDFRIPTELLQEILDKYEG